MHGPTLLASKLRLRELTSLAEFIHPAYGQASSQQAFGIPEPELLMIGSMIANSPC